MARWGARVFEGKDVLAPHGTNSGPSPVSLLEPVQVDERRVRQPLLRCHRQGHARQLAQLLLRLLRRRLRVGGQAPFGVLDPRDQRLSVRLPRVEPTAPPGARRGPLFCFFILRLPRRSTPLPYLLLFRAQALTPISVATDRSNNLESL